MKALWLEHGRLRLRTDLARPEPGPGEALVRVLRAGICGTDLQLSDGLYPFVGVPGHEFVGIVEQGGGGLLGRRVVCAINIGCGACEFCNAGDAKHCLRRQAVGIRGRPGGFAEWVCVPESNLHCVPDEVSTDAATFAEPLAAALDIREQVRIGPRDRVVVVGTGRLGQLVCHALAPPVCGELVAVGRDPAKLARLEGIVTRTASSSEIGEGEFHLAVECTGNPEGLLLALRAVRARGTVVLKSTYSPSTAHIDTGRVVVDELRILGSRCGPMDKALDLLRSRGNEIAGLITARFPLARAREAFSASRIRGALKVLIDVDGSRGTQ